jgi:hypothetical protein
MYHPVSHIDRRLVGNDLIRIRPALSPAESARYTVE